MRKHTITVYTNDEYSLYDILNEVRSEIDHKVFSRDNIRQRKFAGTVEGEKTSSNFFTSNNLYGEYEVVAKWESNVVPDNEFVQFQKDN
tara:strand:+ start:235 stop:501 length:267 start_codon:yes stop_codon:yes gene_type:complete